MKENGSLDASEMLTRINVLQDNLSCYDRYSAEQMRMFGDEQATLLAQRLLLTGNTLLCTEQGIYEEGAPTNGA